MDGGIVITTGQAVGAAVWLVLQTAALLAYIRRLYEKRIEDCVTNYDKRLADRDGSIRDLNARIVRLEAKDDQQADARERTIATLEEAVGALKKQTELQEAIAERVTTRRRGAAS